MKKLYNEFIERKTYLDTKVKENSVRIQEIDSYLNSILSKEENDFKVFSPRNVESIYKEQIESNRNEKSSLEKENSNYLEEIETINVEFLNQLLKDIFKEENMVLSIVKN